MLAEIGVSGIDTGRVRYLPSHNNLLGVFDLVHQEFQQTSGLPGVGSSCNRWEFCRLTRDIDLVTIGSVQAISDVSGIPTARKRLVFEWGL